MPFIGRGLYACVFNYPMMSSSNKEQTLKSDKEHTICRIKYGLYDCDVVFNTGTKLYKHVFMNSDGERASRRPI